MYFILDLILPTVGLVAAFYLFAIIRANRKLLFEQQAETAAREQNELLRLEIAMLQDHLNRAMQKLNEK